MIEETIEYIQDKIHAVVSSMIDSSTGKHGDVITRKNGETIILSSNGSATYVRKVERLLESNKGKIKVSTTNQPIVYLAHATEDKEDLAKPIAEYLMQKGIKVWYDQWEIKSGDSLRQKMDQGLNDCTHFLVLLTQNSLKKPWVLTEIDAGFTDALDERIRFMGVRSGVDVSEVSPLLRTRLLPNIDPTDTNSLDTLVDDIWDVSQRPALGERPNHVKTTPNGLANWSKAATAVARHMVEMSKTGCWGDPQLREGDLTNLLDLSGDAITDGIQDLADGGLLEHSQTIGSDVIWPNIGLFVEFDSHFLDFDNSADAVSIAAEVVNKGVEQIPTDEIKELFEDWTIRRFNSALNRLEVMDLVNTFRAIGSGPYSYLHIITTNKTRRFVRDNS